MSRYVMVIDSTKCLNCKACIIACQQRNAVPYSYSRNWIKTGHAPSIPGGTGYQPGACMHCDNPACVDACPTGATWKGPDGTVEMDPARCIGCGSCIAACAYDARYLHPSTGTADKCDYCRGHSQPGQLPACVTVCPTRCRTFGDAENPDDPAARLLANNKAVYVVSPTGDTKPTLTYLNHTVPAGWPREASLPVPMRGLALASAGVTWLGGLALLGVVGVFFKQLILPSDREHRPEKGQDAPKQTPNSGERS